MKNIRFRAWDRKEKKMRYGIEWIWGKLADETMHHEDDWIDEKDCIKMQFTGLCDRNGREIYEGDILKDGEDDLFKVSWDYHNCGFYLESTEDVEYNVETRYILNNQTTVEVIGNIYENPELVEK